MYEMTKQEYSDIHNGLCELYYVRHQLKGIVHPDLVQRLNKTVELIEKGFASVREQENSEFEDKMAYFEQARNHHKFKSVWSMYDIDMTNGLVGRPGFDTVTDLVYEGWDKIVSVSIPSNPSYLQLWKAADELLQLAEDTHHVFIEGFRVDSKDNTKLFLCAGS